MPDYYLINYGFVILGIVITLAASINVRATYARYSKIANIEGLTGADAAQAILSAAGINDVEIRPIGGSLTDHYSPREKVLRLSEGVFGASSVAAVGIAAHECGHAIQHKEAYGPLKLRSLSVPLANIGGYLSWPVILLGIWFELSGLAQFGIFLFMFVVFFELITLPVEFDASRRALKALENSGLLVQDEIGGARKVLSAAALTYVAALLSTILQLLRLIMLVNGGRRRR
jgi:Zn-dependent membrane protease YugP